MSDRLSQLRIVDPVLTQIARGYQNADFIAESLFPIAPVPKESVKVPQFGKEAFRIYNTERAIRARSNRLTPEGITTVTQTLEEHDIEYPIDYREADEAADILNLEQDATETVQSLIQLRREKQAADLAQDVNNYPSGNKITLSGTSQFTDKSNSDPIGVMKDGKSAIRSKIGRYPNMMVIGAASYEALQDHPQLIERIKYSMRGVLTVQLMQEIFDIPNIRIGMAVYADENDNFVDLWQDNIILAYVPQASGERSYKRPSYGYTLRKRGWPLVDRYEESGGKITLIRSTDIFKVALMGAEAGYLINDTNA